MISDDIRQLVERTFPDPFGELGDDAEFRGMVLAALEAGQSLSTLGRRLKCEDWELLALKRIEVAHRSGIVPDRV